MKVLTVIVTYNGMRWVDRCLNSVLLSAQSSDLYVVDNASGDGTADYIQTTFPTAILHRSTTNLGFGAANNIGISYAVAHGYDYVYLLNQDAWLMPNTLEKLILYSQQHADYGILSPVQMQADEYTLDANFQHGPCGQNPALLQAIQQGQEGIFEVETVMAAHWLLPIATIKRVGGFSPTFKLYAEDDNYIDRAQYHGLKVGVVAGISAVHDRSTRQITLKKKVYQHRVNGLRYFSNPSFTRRWAWRKFLGESIKNAWAWRSLRPLFPVFFILFHWLSIRANRRLSRWPGLTFLPATEHSMRVLFVAHTVDLSGANRSLMQLVQELMRDYGVSPFFVFPIINIDDEHNIKTEAQRLGIPFIEHRMTHFKRHEHCSLIERTYYVVYQFFYVLHLLWMLRGQKFDMVHTNASVNDTGAYISRAKHIPHVWHLREFGQQDFGLVSCLGKGYERWIYRKATRVIAISQAIKEAFSDVIAPERMEVVYNGILPVDTALHSAHDNEVVQLCMVGRIDEKKNQFEVLQAAKQLIEWGVCNFHLTFVGRWDETCKQKMDAYIAENKLADYVSFLGVRFDVPQILQHMDIGLMLSCSEAFGRVTVEYQLQNLAVVAAETGANAELIEQGKTGLLYSYNAPQQLAEQLRVLITDRAVLLQVAAQGREHAMAHFTSAINTANVHRVFRSAIEDAKKTKK